MTRSLKFASVVAAGLALSACGGTVFNGPEDVSSTQMRHPITVNQDVATLMIEVTPETVILSQDEADRVRAFARAYKTRGHGALNIASPNGAPNTSEALGLVADVTNVLYEEGVEHRAITVAPYRASQANVNAPLILTYQTYVATTAPCGNWSQDFSYMPKNNKSPNYGCAYQKNLAAMVSEPRDLVVPRTMTPSDAQRRDTILESYRKGEITAAERTDDESGQVSDAVE